MAKKLSDDDLVSILRREEQVAQQWQDAELLGPRQSAFDYYNRDPKAFGVEEGQSSVVTSEFADTVESVMPGLMRVFASGDEIAKFTPIEQQDEKWAKQATQFVPHVLMRENDGYRSLYWFFKDVLMYRLATMTVDVMVEEKTKKSPVEGWTEEQMALAEETALEQGYTEVEFKVTQDEFPRNAGVATLQGGGDPSGAPAGPGWSPQGEVPGLPAGESLEQAAATFSGTISITKRRKRVKVDNVAPEDLLVSPADVRDLDEASFAGYRKQVTASDLRVLGLSQEEIDSLASDKRSSPEEDQRQDGQSQSQSRKDDQRRLWLVVAYVKADANGDGISEMLRCVYAHAGGLNGAIIERMEWEEGEAPITIGSAILMSHSIVGRSLFDQTSDLQDVGTVVTRGMLDNIYLTNRPRPMINGRVNINSVLDMTPGMPVQSDGNGNPAENISWLQFPSIIEPALSALGYLENKRDQRTGTSRLGNNMDSDALSDASRMTKGGTSMVMSVAQERQELMANVLAATAITRLMRHIYRAIKRAAEGPAKYYANGEWQECDPTKWPDDMHLIVNVGTSNKQMEQMNLLGIGAAQEKIGLAQGGFNGPIVKMEHIANTGRKLAEASGFRATTQFFASEKDVEQAVAVQAQQGPQKSPEQLKVEGQLMALKQKQDGEINLARERAAAELDLESQKSAAKLRQMKEEADVALWLEREKAAIAAQLERDKAAANVQLKREELAQEAVLGAMEIKSNEKVQGAAQQREQEV
jgi:hypothetical protein